MSLQALPPSRPSLPRFRLLSTGFLVFAMAVALLGCATERGAALSRGDDPRLGPEPYRVGPVTVLIRPQPEVEFLCRLRLSNPERYQRVMGCYLPDSKTIVSVADPYILLHEFKHHFENKWHE